MAENLEEILGKNLDFLGSSFADKLTEETAEVYLSEVTAEFDSGYDKLNIYESSVKDNYNYV